MQTDYPPAPPWRVSHWLNSPSPLTLQALRGRVVVLHAFQMLCPACVSHGLPQALRIHQLFSRDMVCVIGLHTVFEHHAVMGLEALKVFVHEYRLPFPIGVDEPGPHGGVPLTMQAYGLQGTPSLVLIDKAGRVRLNHFGHLDDLSVGAAIGQLVEEAGPAQAELPAREAGHTGPGGCTGEACPAGSSGAGSGD